MADFAPEFLGILHVNETLSKQIGASLHLFVIPGISHRLPNVLVVNQPVRPLVLPGIVCYHKEVGHQIQGPLRLLREDGSSVQCKALRPGCEVRNFLFAIAL